MISAIKADILNILANDERLYAGGNAYADGWQGVQKMYEDPIPTANSDNVSLFPIPYISSDNSERPCIYFGAPSMQASDKLEFDTCSGSRSEMRVMTVPLLCVAQVNDAEYLAEAQVYQLKANVRAILFDQNNAVGQPHWYLLEEGCGTEIRDFSSAAGGQSIGAGEAIAIIPLEIHYVYKADSPA